MLNLLKLVALKRYDYVLYLQLVQNKMAYLFVYERKKERARQAQKYPIKQKIKRWIWVEGIWVLYYFYPCNLSV